MAWFLEVLVVAIRLQMPKGATTRLLEALEVIGSILSSTWIQSAMGLIVLAVAARLQKSISSSHKVIATLKSNCKVSGSISSNWEVISTHI